MDQWEYFCKFFSLSKTRVENGMLTILNQGETFLEQELRVAMNRHGKDGWELTASHIISNGVVLMFKRKLSS